MKIEIDFRGFNEIEETLRSLPAAVAERVLDGAVRKFANLVRRKARDRAPVYHGDVKLIKSGGKIRRLIPRFLKFNIVARRDKLDIVSAVAYRVGATKAAFYAHMQEFGTSKMAARPFLRPAFDELSPQAAQIIGQEVFKGIVRELKRLNKKLTK